MFRPLVPFVAHCVFPVNYGEEHSLEHGHTTQYGRMHTPGLYPEWSNENPLHFLGHSFVSTSPPVELLDRDRAGPTGWPYDHQTSMASEIGFLR